MEWWQISLICVAILAIQIYLLFAFFLFGFIMDKDAKNFRKDLITSFIGSIFWPLAFFNPRAREWLEKW